MKYLFILLLFFGAFACAQQSAKPDGPVGLDAKAFRDRSATEPNAVILDVRTPEEVREGIVPGARTLDFHAADFAVRIGELDKSKTYFVYCKAGGRSSRTIDLMQSSGFKHVHELEGGYLEWTRAGYPVKKP
jgi:phage shock protein E